MHEEGCVKFFDTDFFPYTKIISGVGDLSFIKKSFVKNCAQLFPFYSL